jgi:hypothetical protein
MAAAAVAVALIAAVTAIAVIAAGVCRRLLLRRYQRRIWTDFTDRHRALDRKLDSVWHHR